MTEIFSTLNNNGSCDPQGQIQVKVKVKKSLPLNVHIKVIFNRNGILGQFPSK